MPPIPAHEPTKPEDEKPLPFGSGYKLIGKDYSTNDLVAKVTGQSKYAEDFRAEGMLFCRLVLSPMPHGRIKSINAEKALAMPGVRGILTAAEVPGHADYINDNGTRIKADKWGELALTDEPMYQGEPILAVAAVDELTAANAIEMIEIEMEPLPFNTDPVDSLRPGSANAREDGNVWVREDGDHGREKLTSFKWTDEDFAAEKEGRMPTGKATEHWSYGDVDAGFKNAAVVLDETFLTADVSHQCLETRTAMAHWQNGKLYVYTGTQSTFQTVAAIARWMQIDEDKVVFISEYTGGGFGSKITGALTLVIPALLSKKLNAPVMMRISREEEHFIGRARPGIRARTKIGFAKDGRITAVDMFLVSDAGSYGSSGDGGACGSITSLLYQPPAMRWRNVTVATNTPPRSAQSAPGGMQAIAIIEPILSKAARKLGVDQVALRRVNCPEGKAEFGPPNPRTGKRGYTTSCFLKQALDAGAKQFNWSERAARQPKQIGSKVRGMGVSLSTYHGGSTGFDGLIMVTPQGRVQIQSGIGNLGTEAVIDVHRAAAEVLNMPWEACDIVWGDTSKHLPYTCASGGSQTTHAMTRAAHAVGLECAQRLKEVAAKSLGGQPDDYEVANLRVSRKGGGGGMSFAEAAQHAIKLGGIYDGHDVNPDVDKATQQAVTALAGQGLVASAKDKFPHDGDSYSYLACFAEVEADVETGKYHIVDYLAYADVGTVLHPAALGGQVLGRSTLGIAHAIGQKWVIDPQYGATVAKRFYQNKPPTILDVPVDMKWNALNIPDPETPVGARGCGEPPVGGGCASILNALSDALGDDIFQRTPVNADTILTSYEAGRPMQNPLLAHI
ncbi:MAG TPA: xanthine dehydrogenase family protein molybdopterin-binding subunit [Terracidiphilus sp.]|jgi:CO/xanthine dehydrogenase Mo-binding subunit|nr:xanthine dehydrogenase family protein molybdopterin-binding subunit [Terracidiphilus sp.]